MSSITLLQIFISPGHNFFGHHGKEPSRHPAVEQSHIECLAGRGIVGDRFFDFKESYKGQITFLESEQIQRLEEQLDIPEINPAKLRRNVITQGIDLNSLIGKTFTLCGITFEGTQECKPCYWMDHAVGEGAEQCLEGHGGLRARILSNGTIQPGSHQLEIH